MSDNFPAPDPLPDAPAVSGEHPRRRLFTASALLLSLTAALAWYLWPTAEPRGMPPGGGAGRPTPIVVEAASRGDFPVRLSAIGTVIPRIVVTVRSRVDGTLNRLAFTEGQTVRAGDLLAEIDPRPYQVALTQVGGQLARDEALLANARADLERYEGLARLDAIPAQQLDTQRALVHQYEAAVKVDQGAVDNARLQLSYTRITAPADGRVGLRQVDPGNLVRSSDANGLVVITQVQPVTVVFPIPEADLADLLPRLGATGGPEARPPASAANRHRPAIVQDTPGAGGTRDSDALPVEAWDRDGKVLLASGHLLTVDNQLDVTTGTVKVKAIFPNRDDALFPNQFVNVRLVVKELADAVLIPAAAVQRGAQGSFVWLLGADGHVAMRRVDIGRADGDVVPVMRGLQAGDKVAVDGFDRLREGGRVEVVSRESRNVKAGGARRAPRHEGGAPSNGTGPRPARP